MGTLPEIADAEDALFARVAAHNELAGDGQLQAALDFQKKLSETGARVTLGEILLHQGVMDTRTLDSILALQRSKMPNARHPLALRRKGLTPERDRNLAQAAVDQGRVPAGKLEEAREIQGRLRELGFDRRLGEILWWWDLIDEAAIEQLLHAEKRRARMEGDETRRLRGRVQAGPVSDMELLFGRLAIKNGFLTPETLNEALDLHRQCRELGVRLKVPEVLVSRKVMTEENVAQIAELMSVEKEQLLTSSMGRVMLRKLDDESMLHLLVEREFLRPDQAEEARAIQAKLKSLGLERRAGEVLLDRQFVSNEILYAALNDQLRARLRQALKSAEAVVAEGAERRRAGEAGAAAPDLPAKSPDATPGAGHEEPRAAATPYDPDSARAIHAAMIEELRRKHVAAPARSFPWGIALGGLVLLAITSMWFVFRDPSPTRANPYPVTPEPTRPPTNAGGPTRPTPLDATAVATAAKVDPQAARSFLEQRPAHDPQGVDLETRQAVDQTRTQDRKELDAHLARARSLLADSDPNQLELAVTSQATPDGVVFEIFGLAPFPDGIPVTTRLQYFGEPIPEAAKVVTVRDRLIYARLGPLPAGRRVPPGLYTAVAEFSALFALGSEEAVREAGVADHMVAFASTLFGSVDEVENEADQVRAFHRENLDRVAAFEREAREAVQAGPEANPLDRWTEWLEAWGGSLVEVERQFEAYRQSLLISRTAEADRQIMALLPIANKALRAVATSSLAAHGAQPPPQYEFKRSRPGEAVIPQEYLGALAGELRRAREAVQALDDADPLLSFGRRDLLRRLQESRSLQRDLTQALATLQDATGTAHGGGFEARSPVGWLKKWLTRVGLLRRPDRGLHDMVLGRRLLAEQERLDELLSLLAELGKIEIGAILKLQGSSLPVDLRPVGPTDGGASAGAPGAASPLSGRLEAGWNDLEKMLRGK